MIITLLQLQFTYISNPEQFNVHIVEYFRLS